MATSKIQKDMPVLWSGKTKLESGTEISIPNLSNYPLLMLDLSCDSGKFSCVIESNSSNFALNGPFFVSNHAGVNQIAVKFENGALKCTNCVSACNGSRDTTSYTYLIRVIGMH